MISAHQDLVARIKLSIRLAPCITRKLVVHFVEIGAPVYKRQHYYRALFPPNKIGLATVKHTGYVSFKFQPLASKVHISLTINTRALSLSLSPSLPLSLSLSVCLSLYTEFMKQTNATSGYILDLQIRTFKSLNKFTC